ncbi:MAG: thioredoxin family protein [Dehalobacterium sp.]
MILQQLDANGFEEIINDNGEPCLVIFSRRTCHVCQEVVPVLEDLASKYQGRFGFYYVDVEEQRPLFQRFSLKGVPQILFFNDGECHGKLTGNVEDKQIEEKIAEFLK